MRSLVLSLVLLLATLGTLGAPSAAQADHRVAGFHSPAFATWRGGSRVVWRGGSRFVWRGGSFYRGGFYGGYPGGFYGGYPGGFYSGFGYGFYRPGISIGVGVYPYSAYDYGLPLYSSYASPSYRYASPILAYSTPSYSVTPSLAASTVASPPQYTVASPPADPPPAQADNAAHIKVVVPAEAQIFFNGSPTRKVGEEREFVSPPLTPGQSYRYTIEARWMENGREVDQTRTVTVAAGQAALINFNVPDAGAGPEVLPPPNAPK
jgi:uncharacterized protein (TIGR03000 family)